MIRLLDTTVLIDFLRGRPAVSRVEHLLDAGDDLATTAVNVEELARGLLGGETPAVSDLLRGLTVLPIDGRAGWLAGSWRREHAARGITLAQADCLIAATAVQHRASLITGNPKDFPMPEVDLVHWPVGS